MVFMHFNSLLVSSCAKNAVNFTCV